MLKENENTKLINARRNTVIIQKIINQRNKYKMKKMKLRAKVTQALAMIVISTTLFTYFIWAANYTPMLYMALRKNHPNPIIPRSSLEENAARKNATAGTKHNKSRPTKKPNSWMEDYSSAKIDHVSKFYKKSPRVVLLWTTWRSGSTYLGELLANAKANTFYSMEPLHFWKVNLLHADNPDTLFARNYLHDLLRCRLQKDYQQQLDYMSHQRYYMKWNGILSRKCKKKRTCADPAFINDVCRQAEVHVAKVLRLSLRWVWSLLQDNRLDLRVIYLARDPRAVLLSRARVDWCLADTCNSPTKVCDLLEDDLKQVESLIQSFPDKFLFLQYEQINTDPEGSLRNIMSFVDLPVTESQLKLLKPASVLPDSIYSTRKNAKTQSERWRTTSDYQKVLLFQRSCEKPLKMLGLRLFNSEGEFHNLSLPLLLNAESP